MKKIHKEINGCGPDGIQLNIQTSTMKYDINNKNYI